MKRPWLKAGLIGGLALVVFNLIGLVPALGCISPLLWLVGLAGAGALAGYLVPPRREGGRAAGQGAIAGIVAGLIGGLVSVALAPLGLSLAGGSEGIISQLPPDSLLALQQAGLDPKAVFGGGTMAGITAACCLPTGLVMGAILGALGGWIFAAANPGTSPGGGAQAEQGLLPPSA